MRGDQWSWNVESALFRQMGSVIDRNHNVEVYPYTMLCDRDIALRTTTQPGEYSVYAATRWFSEANVSSTEPTVLKIGKISLQ